MTCHHEPYIEPWCAPYGANRGYGMVEEKRLQLDKAMTSKFGSNHLSLMRTLAKLTSILFAFVFLGMQFVPTTTTPKPSATTGVHMAEVINPQVGAILDRSCQDCHSSRTAWPWYSHVAPVSWIVSKHVSAGREILDFSDWANQPPSADERMLICDAVSDGRMPLPEYTLIHRHARLSKRDVELICNWASAPSAPMTSQKVNRGNLSTSESACRSHCEGKVSKLPKAANTVEGKQLVRRTLNEN